MDQRANKMQVKDAVETAFNVKVLDVNIVNIPAKRGRYGRSTVVQEAGLEEGGCDAGAGRHDPVLRRRLYDLPNDRAGAG